MACFGRDYYYLGFILVASFGLIHQIECRKNRLNQREFGSGRAGSGGQIEKDVPEYIGTAWMKDIGEGDMFWAGMAISMGKNYVLIHKTVYKDIVTGGSVTNENGILNKVVIPGKPMLDIQDDGFRSKRQNWELVKESVGGKPFNLVKILDSNGYPSITSYPKPNLETKMNGPPKNCRAYGWAIPPPDKQMPPVSRQFVSLKVKNILCEDDGECTINLEPNSGDICPSNGDRGIPILCGVVPKLTYLVYKVYSKGCVTNGIFAVHVASMVEDIDRFTDGQNPNTRPPPKATYYADW